MNSVKMAILGGLIGIVSQAALAFQETTSGGGQGVTQGSDLPAAKLGLPTAPRAIGPEIKLPGLGTIGALPKLDFGLELLYGATGDQPAGPREDKSDSGAQIRGTLKYRFPN